MGKTGYTVLVENFTWPYPAHDNDDPTSR